MQSNKLNENLQHNDLNNLVSSTISIDQFKSKVGEDKNVVVVSVEVMHKDPANDLSSFLETGHEALDIDVSLGPNKNQKFNVFIELDRNSKLYDSICKILKDIERVDNNFKNVMFTSYKNTTPAPWNKENFEERVISSSHEYVLKFNPEAKTISERIRFLNEY